MNSQSNPVADAGQGDSLEPDQRWQLVQRIVKSHHFARSARLQEFLLYVCRCALAGQSNEISEQRIGERVFQRPHYNPTEDNIVRSQARLLRQKLENYFASEGYREPLFLVIPKGGYTPEFVARPTELSADAVSTGGQVRAALRTSLVRGLMAAIVVLGIVVAILASLLGAKESRPEARTASTPVLSALWSQLFSPSTPTTVIVPDSTVGMVQEATKEPVDLATYLRRSPNRDNQKVREIEGTLRGFSIRRYTTFDSVSTGVKITQLADQFNGRTVVRYARDMTLREFSPGNVVMIGRASTNPWSTMFEDKLNFWFYSDLSRGIAICKNRSPQPGEQAEYSPIDEGAKRTVYATVAFLPNLNNAGNVLIIGGTSSGAQDVAAQVVTNEELIGSFMKDIPRIENRLPYFEILIRTITLAGVAQEPEIIAHRVLSQ